MLVVVVGALAGKTDVDKGGDGLNGGIVLADLEEVEDAFFIVRVPAGGVEAAEFGVGV